MSEKTGIEWATRTKGFWKDALAWEKAAAGTRHHGGECPRIFPSLCDWLDDEVPIEWLADFLKLIHDTPNLDWQLLTKRPENWSERLHKAMRIIDDERDEWVSAWLDCIDMPERGDIPQNVWIGVSVEDQKRADERIPLLLKIPAKIKFLSVEPLLEKVDLTMALEALHTHDPMLNRNPALIDWVIVGGESGRDRRDCGIEAICDVARQCIAAGVPCFVKQDCAFKSGQQGRIPADIWALKQFPNT